jgi:hypothetical protein
MDEMSVKLAQAFQEMNDLQKEGKYGTLPSSIPNEALRIPAEIEDFLKKRDEEIEKNRNLSVGVYG